MRLRSRAQVEAEILETRAALILAESDAAEHADEPDAWAFSDLLFEQLVALSIEVQAIPVQRLPSARDGHTAPQPY